MKKILFLLAACFVFVACGMKSKTEGTVLPAEKETAVRSDGVEVLCFHSKQRCATCIAIEKNARTAIDSAFADRRRRPIDGNAPSVHSSEGRRYSVA